MQYFCEIVKEQSVTQASKKLSVTQSALSSSLHRLEEEAGRQLFDRVGRRIVLNQQGETFYRHARIILKEYQEAIWEVQPKQEAAGNDLILSWTESDFPERLFVGFKVKHPEVNICEKWISYADLSKIEKDQETDFFFSSLPLKGKGIRCHRLMRERLYLLVYRSHSLAQKAFVRMEELKEEQFLTTLKGDTGRVCFEEICRKAGFSPKISLECYQHQMQAMVQQERGIGIFSEELIRSGTLSEELQIIPLLDDYCCRDIYIGYQTERPWREIDSQYLNYLGITKKEFSS